MGNQNILTNTGGVNIRKERKIFTSYINYLETPRESAENLFKQIIVRMKFLIQ